MVSIIVLLGVFALLFVLVAVGGAFYLGAYVALRARDSLPFGGFHWKRIPKMTPEREAEIEAGKPTTQRPRSTENTQTGRNVR